MEEVVHERGNAGLVVGPGARGAVSVGSRLYGGVCLKIGLDPVEEGVRLGLEVGIDLGADLEHEAEGGGDRVVVAVVAFCGDRSFRKTIGEVHPVDLGVHLLAVDGVLRLVVDVELGDLEAASGALVEHVV